MSDEPAGLANPQTMARVTLEKHIVETRAATLKLRIERGELVRKSAAEAAHYAIGTRIRDTMLTASSRHAALLAAKYGVDAGQLANALDRIVRQTLNDLADEGERRDREQGV